MATETITRRGRGRPRQAKTEKSTGTVQALERGILILSTLAQEDKANLTQLALQTGMPPSSAHRLLTTLQSHGFTDFDETTNLWMIGVEAFRIGSSFQRRMTVVEAAWDTLRELVTQTGETANLAVPDGAEVVFVSQVESQHPIRAFFAPGTRAPMHASGIGKALLATLENTEITHLLQRTGLKSYTPRTLSSPEALFENLRTINARGWSLDDEERNLGMRCVAAPIYNQHAEAVAGVSISGPAARLSADTVGEYGPMVRRAAAQITELLGGRVPSDASENG